VKLESVEVRDGAATLIGSWPNREMREEIADTLKRRVEGVSRVLFASARQPEAG